jgi:hypothetical protein
MGSCKFLFRCLREEGRGGMCKVCCVVLVSEVEWRIWVVREEKRWCMGVRDDGGWKEWRVLIGDSGEVEKR